MRRAGSAELRGVHWEGEGRVDITLIDDPLAHVTSGGEFDFWFVVNSRNQLAGELEMTYEAQASVQPIVESPVPAPGGGFTWNPTTVGRVTDSNPTRRFAIIGTIADGQLHIAPSGLEDVEPIEFTVRQNAAIAGASIGPVRDSIRGPGGTILHHEIAYPPFHPLPRPAPAEKLPPGPYIATYCEANKRVCHHWTARQVGGEHREIRITPRMQEVLDSLRRELAIE